MKFKCPFSGLTYSLASLDPAYQNSKVVYSAPHPLLSLPAKEQLHLIQRVLDSALSEANYLQFEQVNLYLTTLSCLTKLGCEFRASADFVGSRNAVAKHWEKLFTLTLSLPEHKYSELPKFVLTKETADLAMLGNWVEALQDVQDTWSISAAELVKNRKLTRLEKVVELMFTRRITDRNITKVAQHLANWASFAAEFPTSSTWVPTKDSDKEQEVSLERYWKVLIQASFTENHIGLLQHKIPAEDLEDLVEYLELNLPHGTTYAAVLMRKLRHARDVLVEFRRPKLEPVLVPQLGEQVVRKVALVSTADLIEPQPHQFATKMEFTKARLAWGIAVRTAQKQREEAAKANLAVKLEQVIDHDN